MPLFQHFCFVREWLRLRGAGPVFHDEAWGKDAHRLFLGVCWGSFRTKPKAKSPEFPPGSRRFRRMPAAARSARPLDDRNPAPRWVHSRRSHGAGMPTHLSCRWHRHKRAAKAKRVSLPRKACGAWMPPRSTFLPPVFLIAVVATDVRRWIGFGPKNRPSHHFGGYKSRTKTCPPSHFGGYKSRTKTCPPSHGGGYTS